MEFLHLFLRHFCGETSVGVTKCLDRLSHLGIWAIIPCSPYMVIVHVLVSLRLEASWDFFPKDRMAPKENRFNSSSTRKCNFIGKKKKLNKKAARVFLKVYPWKTHETKIPPPATKDDNYCFLMMTKPLADRYSCNCSLFIRHFKRI